MEEQYSKRIRSNNNSNDSVVVDRISSLPDCILGVILSFLYTKEAVATSVLSKRWKSAWLDVHNLHLFSCESDEHTSFIRFVHKALRLTHGRPLDMFTMVWRPSISSHVICWIDAAISRNVRDIDLFLDPGVGDMLIIPVCGFNCESLQSLKINDIFFDFDTTAVCCLPRLETLELSGARFNGEEVFEKLINGCPMLRCLKPHVYFIANEDSDDDSDDDAEEDFMYIVSLPSLRHLDMHIQRRCSLKLNAPKLEYLKLHGRFSSIFVEKSLSSLVEADFAIWLGEHDFVDNSIVEAVRALDCVKFLTVSADILWAFSRTTINLSTEFKRLVKLVAGNYCCSVQDFIHNSENLEELIIHKDYWWTKLINPPDHSRWRAPIEVPRCLSNSLKRVQLDGYKGLQDEREMIRYMLEHGTALEVMKICCASMERGEKLKLIQEIRVPIKSRVCKVQFASSLQRDG